jgi:hypothetical protein
MGPSPNRTTKRFLNFSAISRRISRSISGDQNQIRPNNESLIERELKIKTFIVYDLDSKMPIAVGEQVSAETARCCASAATGNFHANLLAEEIDLEKRVSASPESGTIAGA